MVEDISKTEEALEAGWRSEAGLAGEWGIKRHEMAIYRQSHLREGLHYGRPGGLQIYFTPEGISVARAHFRPKSVEILRAEKMSERAAEMGEWAMPPLPGTPLDENVCRVLTSRQNPRLVRVVNGVGEIAYVEVTSNKKFRPGMLLDLRSCVRLRKEWGSGRVQHERYRLMIALPRYNGRWGYSVLTNPNLGRLGQYIRRGRDYPRIDRVGM